VSASERHERIKRIFDRACDLPEGERSAFLDRECGGDAELRAELTELLAAEGIGALAERQRGAGLQMLAEELCSSLTSTMPERIHQYRILREIGRGGMGIVYEAEQEHPRRRVALKVMRTPFASPELLKRFRHEAHLLGQLEHRGIARVYEAGTASVGGDSWPFFAMEYIEGRPIDAHVREENAGAARILELIARVCDAVDHAHRRGIVHRDLKPGNVLVRRARADDRDADAPKILDFGVARATDADLALTTIRTSAGVVVGTLAYMSPEQLEGRADVDARCDVYALGVLLYELLAGRPPFDLSGKPMAEAARLLAETDPPSLGALVPGLRGDVESIVAKAMEKDRERRYRLASELAEDIRRHLRNETISARPASAMYQLRKFTRRNRVLVGGVLATTLALVIGLVVSSTAFLQARSERDARTEALQVSDAVTDFLSEMLAAPRPEEQGREVSVRQVLDGAADTIGDRFADLPLVEAKLRRVIGESYFSLGEYAVADSQVSRAIAILADEAGERNEEVLDAYQRLGELKYVQGDYDGALAAFTSALDGYRVLEPPNREGALNAFANVAFLRMQQGRFDEARTMFDDAAAEADSLLGPDHETSIDLLANRAMLALRTGDNEQAEKFYLDVIERSRRVRGADHRETVLQVSNLGTLYLNQERYDEGLPLIRQALASQERTLGPAHSQTLITLGNLGQSTAETGEIDEGLAIVEEGLRRSHDAYGDRHPNTVYLATALGRILVRAGDFDRARDVMATNLTTARDVLGDDTDATYAAWIDYVRLLHRRGEYAASAASSVELAETMAKVIGPGHWRVQAGHSAAARAYQAMGDCAKAEAHHRAAFDIAAERYRPGIARELGELEETCGKPDEAARWRAIADGVDPEGSS